MVREVYNAAMTLRVYSREVEMNLTFVIIDNEYRILKKEVSFFDVIMV